MALVPPPRAATKKEFKKNPQKYIDELNRWARYEGNPLGCFCYIWDFIRGRIL